MRKLFVAIIAISMLSHTVASAWADDNAFFEIKIRPILVERCYECHSGLKNQEGGLRLDSRQGWQQGGDSGPAIVPGEIEGSLLIQRIKSEDADSVMPPKSAGMPLTAQQIADFEVWVRTGAFDPREGSMSGAPAKKDWDTLFHERLDWWSLKPVKVVDAPEVSEVEWSQTAEDRFLRRSMELRQISPAPVASASTLLRRACLVLTGLPPTPELVQEYERTVAKESVDKDSVPAFEQLVERLLDSHQFGERFARHWLDVVRFSETHGNEWNYDAAYAWRYRDYVIRAFNADVPYDRFIREHIAGDLLSTSRRSEAIEFDESPLGTAFYRFGEINHDSCTQFPVIGYDILDNQLDTLTKAFQGTTAACARCHDHKLDAISQKDYYALLAVLRSSRPVMRTLDDPKFHQEDLAKLLDLKREIRAALVEVWKAEASSLDASRLDTIADPQSTQPIPLENPIHLWRNIRQAEPAGLATVWSQLTETVPAESARREEFNRTHFSLLADFRERVPADWKRDGWGVADAASNSGDFAPATEGEAAIKCILPAGVMTFGISDRLNGALRSPTLSRTHSKVSFEIIGGRFSLARLVFNNCQFNYDRQHSIHHDAWSWITIDWPDQTDGLNPYIELLTFWDNPKFPDPLGTLGKDIEVQREPYAVHAKDPRSWWGIRRIVLHDVNESPKASLVHLDRLLKGDAPQSADEVALRFAKIAAEVVDRFGKNQADDHDMVWLDWLLRSRVISNQSSSSPRLTELITRYREIESRLPRPTTFPGLADESQPVSQPVFARGDLQKPRDVVSRGYLRMLTPEEFSIAPMSSGRRELAEVIASPSNPLTARVMVNRIWQWVFGRGLVGTPDDFGHLGEALLHPELLDHLAARFVAEGWSVKKLIRALVLTRAFQSDGSPSDSAQLHDPQNHTFSHYWSRGAEAEVVRDSLLAVSGRLNPQMFGPSVHPYRVSADNEKRLFAGPLDGDGRRSLYIKFQLMEQPAFLRAFNLPGGKVVEGRRGATHTVEQSLAMLNDPLVLMLADHWAGLVISDGAQSLQTRLQDMFRRALSREPTDVELSRFVEAVYKFGRLRGAEGPALLSSRETWQEVAHTIFNLQEFRFIP